MTRLIDLTGQKFTRLTVIERAPNNGIKQARWITRCDCGKQTITRGEYLRNGQAKSCGCYSRGAIGDRRRTHGMTDTRTYCCWRNMLNRCRNKNVRGYKDYGARGIAVCRRWQCFSLFLKDMGLCPPGLTIERIDNNKGYSQSNCRWATYSEQAANTRRARLLTHNGRTLPMRAWERKFGLSFGRIFNRLQLGWTVEKAITTPSRNTALEIDERRTHDHDGDGAA